MEKEKGTEIVQICYYLSQHSGGNSLGISHSRYSGMTPTHTYQRVLYLSAKSHRSAYLHKEDGDQANGDAPDDGAELCLCQEGAYPLPAE